jgi:DNA polymerase (family 10)
MASETNRKVIRLLNQVADLLELEGANDYRIRAFRGAANIVATHNPKLDQMVQNGEPLSRIDGVGDHLASRIREIVLTGHLKEIDELKKRLPNSLQSLLNIPELSPKKIQRLYLELGINNLNELYTAIETGQVHALTGFDKQTVYQLREYLQSL